MSPTQLQPPGPDDSALLPTLQENLVGELERRGRVSLAAFAAVLALLWVILHRAAALDRRIAWLFAGLGAAVLLRAMLAFIRSGTPRERWLRFTLGSTVSGLMLSALTWTAFPHLSPMETGLLGMTMAGLTTAAMLSMAPSIATFLIYMVPMMFTLALASHASPPPEYPRAFQALVWVYLAALSGLGLQVHQTLRREILLRLRVEQAAIHDPLTGLHNRRFLAMFMGPEVAQVLRFWHSPEGPKPTLKLMILDIDHFKSVNDEYGHAAGDAVLQQLAALLKETLRKPDILVRWGGEEFVIAARNTGRDLPLGLAERIRRRVAEHAFTLPDGRSIRRTCSIGFTLYPFLPGAPEQVSWEQCVALADAGLYLAKNGGRDCWVGLEAAGGQWGESESVLTTVEKNPTDAEQRGLLRLIRKEEGARESGPHEA